MRIDQFVDENMGGWNHKGANVTKNVKVEPGWKDPAEKQKDKIRAEIAKQRAEKKMPNIKEEENGIPEVGDVIRTKKMQMEGKVESVGQSSAGYPEVMFRVEDGRLMKTPLSNVIVIQKLADCNIVMEVKGERVDEISNEVLAKYKEASGKDASEADKKGNFEHGHKRFKGIVNATKKQFANDKKETKEGSMGGINRCAPAQDVSYEHVLDEVMSMWEKERTDELSIGKLKAYKDAASSPDVARHSPLLKVVKHTQGANTAAKKIRTKTGDRTGMSQPDRGTYESK